MARSLGLLLVFALLAGAAPAPDTVLIKVKEPAAGDVVEVEDESTEETKFAILDAEGKANLQTAETKVKSWAYRETVLARPDANEPPTRLRRQYTRAVVKTDGKAQTLPYQGKTVLIEKGKDGKYRFQVENGKELAGPDAEHLDAEFNKERTNDTALMKVLLPTKPVGVGDTWRIAPEPLAKELSRGEHSVVFDTGKATATGRLTEVYRKDSLAFGKIDFVMDLPLKQIGDGKEKIEFQEGARVAIKYLTDLCIDGRSHNGSVKSTLTMEGTATLPGAGEQGKVVVSAKVTQHGQRKELPRP